MSDHGIWKLKLSQSTLHSKYRQFTSCCFLATLSTSDTFWNLDYQTIVLMCTVVGRSLSRTTMSKLLQVGLAILTTFVDCGLLIVVISFVFDSFRWGLRVHIHKSCFLEQLRVFATLKHITKHFPRTKQHLLY